ncbi:MAG: hypothetical protein FWE31_02710 [Firmicutes bacterium]|nr:hypothetical protein [Bacillota bacterium]
MSKKKNQVVPYVSRATGKEYKLVTTKLSTQGIIHRNAFGGLDIGRVRGHAVDQTGEYPTFHVGGQPTKDQPFSEMKLTCLTHIGARGNLIKQIKALEDKASEA